MSLGSRAPCPLFLPTSRSIVAFKEPSWALKGNSAQLGRLGQLATRAGARASCPPTPWPSSASSWCRSRSLPRRRRAGGRARGSRLASLASPARSSTFPGREGCQAAGLAPAHHPAPACRHSWPADQGRANRQESGSGYPLYEIYDFGGFVLFTLLRCLFLGFIVVGHFHFQLFVSENISFQSLTSIR